MRPGSSLVRRAALGFALLTSACTNNPYPGSDSSRKVLYGAFAEAPRSLDPAIAYTTTAHRITGLTYETLLEYHYLERPFRLIPGLAEEVPHAEPLEDGRVSYRFRMRPGLLFQDDPCFELGEPGRRTREVVADDVAFEIMRIADPTLDVQVVDPFSNIDGFREFRERLIALTEEEPAFVAKPARERYAAAGGVRGLVVHGPHELEVILAAPYPQILYWFAMPFSAPVPWEAVAYYDGNGGRPRFADHPVGAGPFALTEYDKQFRMVLTRNDNWYGIRHPEWKAPGATYPSTGEPEDEAAGRLAPDLVGRPLPFLERIELRREKESIPTFNKFLQGYYDAAAIIKESFDQVIRGNSLSPEMAARGIRLERTVEPAVFYVGFNMEDEVLGFPAGERSRKIRQAMSLAIDSEEYTQLFLNGRGVPAQSPLPPGLFGHREDFRNRFRSVDIKRARELLAEAGYPGGIDPQTKKPLELSLDTYQTGSQADLRDQFLVNAWRSIGIDVEIRSTTYNEFQGKTRRGAYQIFVWGWVADYPDPENFLFLLTCDMRKSSTGGPNTSNFCDERYDALFEQMRVRESDPERGEIIEQMIAILEEKRPWIELFHPEEYALYHGWLKNVKPFGMSYPMDKYRDVDPELRAEMREQWNEPVTWPAYGLAALVAMILLPGIRTYLRERQ